MGLLRTCKNGHNVAVGRKCKECQKLGEARWYTANIELHRIYRKRSRGKMKAQNPAQLLMYSVRARAKRTDTPFDLTANDLIVPEFCPVLGIPLRFSDKGRGDNTPSVDRIEPDKGYVRGNVAVISWRANRMKSKFELAEFEALVTWWNKQKGTAK